MKKIFTIFACALLSLGLTGCFDDDGEITNTEIFGTWEVTRIYDGEVDEWDEEWGTAYGFIDRITFNSDGTGVSSYEDVHNPESSYSDSFKYSLSGSKLTVKIYGVPMVFTIETLNSDTLILVTKGVVNGNTYTYKSEYIRIN